MEISLPNKITEVRVNSKQITLELGDSDVLFNALQEAYRDDGRTDLVCALEIVKHLTRAEDEGLVDETTAKFIVGNMAFVADCIFDNSIEFSEETDKRLEQIRDCDPNLVEGEDEDDE